MARPPRLPRSIHRSSLHHVSTTLGQNAGDEWTPTARSYYPANDVGNAERYADTYSELRYVPQWKSWLLWNGKQWTKDETGTAARRKAYNLVRHKMPEHARRIDDDKARTEALKHAAASQTAARIEALVKIAETLLTVTPDRIDANPYLLNVQNGTLDLKTAQLRPHDRNDLSTKISRVSYDPDAPCPVWEKFVYRIFQDAEGNERPDLVQYAQRAAGYSLTGDTSEQCLFIPHGIGRNGKTTFLNMLKHAVGDYAHERTQRPADEVQQQIQSRRRSQPLRCPHRRHERNE